MKPRASVIVLLAVAGCASAPPPAPPPNLPPLPRSSIAAVLAHRGELELSDPQVTALEAAEADLQVKVLRLRSEGAPTPPPAGPGAGGPPQGGQPPGLPTAGAPPGTRPGAYPMNTGPGGFPATPGAGPHNAALPGQAGAPPSGARPPPSPPRQDPLKAQEALDARLDDADTAAFLGAEAALTAAQRERARGIANEYRESLFERRALLRGR